MVAVGVVVGGEGGGSGDEEMIERLRTRGRHRMVVEY